MKKSKNGNSNIILPCPINLLAQTHLGPQYEWQNFTRKVWNKVELENKDGSSPCSNTDQEISYKKILLFTLTEPGILDRMLMEMNKKDFKINTILYRIKSLAFLIKFVFFFTAF